MGCADPPSQGVGAVHPISVLELNKKRSGWGGRVCHVPRMIVVIMAFVVPDTLLTCVSSNPQML